MTKVRINADSANDLSIAGSRLENGAITDEKITDEASSLVQADKIEYTYPTLSQFNASSTVPRPVNKRLRDVVSVKDFGAVGDGFTDDTAAIQAAIRYCTYFSRWTSDLWGFTALYFPTGLYLITDTLNIQLPIGILFYGDGPRATQLVFTKQNSFFIKFTTYIDCQIRDMGLIAAESITIGTSGPHVGRAVINPPNPYNGVGLRFDGTGGGTRFRMDSVLMRYWDKCLTTTDNNVNCDNHVYDFCEFNRNTTIWDNTNIQAVIWAFNECKMHFNNGPMFINPGASLRIVGGDFINRGVFIKGGIPSTTIDIFVNGARFETFQNIDPTSAPKYFELSGSTQVTFQDCVSSGGGPLTGKVSATASGLFDVKFIRCRNFTGTFNLGIGNVFNGVAPKLSFEENFGTLPTVTQSLVAGPFAANLEYIKCETGGSGTVTRVFTGAFTNQVPPLDSPEMADSFKLSHTTSSGTRTKDIPVFLPANYTLGLTGVVLAGSSNNGIACTYNLWTDNTKSILLATATTPATPGNFYIEIPYSSLSQLHTVTSASPSMYAELISPSTTTCLINSIYKYRQFS
jgi:hypothetical protein